jgi:hypothetical protein
MKRYSWILALCAIGVLLAQQPVTIRQGGNTAAVSAGGAVKVDGSAVTQPVSGTVTATGPLTDTQLRATPVPVSGTFYQATQPVSASSLPLPTGASTLSEQQTQTTALQLLDDAVATTASAITAKGIAASGTDGTNARVLKTDTSGELQVDVLTLPTVTANATLSAETTKVIGTVNISSGQTVGLAAGTNGIGKLTANSGVTIGAVELAASQSVAVTQATSSSLKAQVDPLTAASWGVGATGAAPPANGNFQTGIGSGATSGLAVGFTVCDQWVDINTTANAQLITGVASRKVYFCSGNIQMNGGANTVAIVSGTGSTCGTGTTTVPGFQGSTTAANGYSFAANSGMTWGGGSAPFARSTNNADNICILVGSATRVVGGLSYAIY